MADDKDAVSEEEEKYETTAQEATSLGSSPPRFNRKRTMIIICCGLAFFVVLSVIFNAVKTSKKSNSGSDDEYAASRANSSFLNSLRDSAIRNAGNNNTEAVQISLVKEIEEEEPEPVLPPVSFNRQQETVRSVPANNQSVPAQQNQGGSYQTPAQPGNSHYVSSLVPQVQGSLFAGNGSTASGRTSSAAPTAYDDYLSQLNSRVSDYQTSSAAPAQNNNNSQNFYESSNPSGAVYGGRFLGENALWVGTIIPGILLTAINTDLPGHVLARVTQNVYDSQTGKKLLIPQGSLMVARYNNSISAAQNRIQIVWDTLIRPDGYQIDFEGANGVDRAGMSGQEAAYHENWFEYAKAAGIISLFSVANAKFTETINNYSESDTTAASVAQANAQFFNQMGSSLVSKAMSIQPTLTVDNGTLINIMLNKTLYLPATAGSPPVQKYILE